MKTIAPVVDSYNGRARAINVFPEFITKFDEMHRVNYERLTM
jgi:hypothetical protein